MSDEWKVELEEIAPGPDHSMTFTMSEPDDTKTVKVITEITWCKYKEQVDALNQRIAELEEKLRWRPVSEKPEKNGKYEVKLSGGNYKGFVTLLWFVKGKWQNIHGWSHLEWRPIPELEVKGE